MTSLPTDTRRFAEFLRYAALAGIVIVVLSWGWTVLDPQRLADARAEELGLDRVGAALGPGARILLLVMAALSGAAVIATLIPAARLCRAYSRDAALSVEAAAAISGIGCGLVAQAAMGVLRRTGDTLALTLGAPAGERTLALGFGSTDLGLALAASLMLMIGLVMRQAVDIARDNAGFV
ncbi:DUF2975 domain-containing protein [Thalassococcus sp. BH17M4-6]|uniref:DUF2975 domain-containing protein n=1 Tax=Thalassococcus sp. BH17M4-6 TaxID=3413148 RepID=UPI003BCBEACB